MVSRAAIEIRDTTIRKIIMKSEHNFIFIGIIRGASAGLAALYELLRVYHDGSSTVHDGPFPAKPRFEAIVLVERIEDAVEHEYIPVFGSRFIPRIGEKQQVQRT